VDRKSVKIIHIAVHNIANEIQSCPVFQIINNDVEERDVAFYLKHSLNSPIMVNNQATCGILINISANVQLEICENVLYTILSINDWGSSTLYWNSRYDTSAFLRENRLHHCVNGNA
jgi:hypothetical protein